ncbi:MULTISPECIES: helix-turn-helix transcriptional regulator [Streptomyces]|uniref:HTH cro/C1-type domain-containing protein n=1 Tax=Streptomyces luteosporeus TaxID=173856 RepID=A0ABP6GE76_9ACTN
MPAPKRLDPARDRVAKFGALLRELRLAKGWSQAKLGRKALMSNSLVSKIETGDYVATREQARGLDDALDARGRLWKMRDELDDNPDAKWVQKAFTFETRAVAFQHTAGLIPAQLQNAEYTREVIKRNLPYYGGDLEDKIRHRERRMANFRKPNPPEFSVVLEEAALHTTIGDQGVMRRQLLDLIELSRQANIDLRIRPFEGEGYIESIGEMTIMYFGSRDPVVYRTAGVRGLLITNQQIVRDHIGVYDRLHADALDPEASRALIRKVVEENYPCAPSDLTCR